ncbi:MAG TPA: hypothetical protein VGZ00_12590, partial [Candidatus Baltobacteraceae bacterium]|nr:hypothetical protein [Candidatus Baltobacteraceae bacterium]
GVTAIFGNSVSVYKTPFIGAPASIIGCGASASTITGCGPSALALDAGGNLFTLWNGAQLEEHLPPYNGNAALVTPLTGLHSYASMALNAIGEVFVVDSVGNEVGEYVSPTNSAPTAIVTSNINGPSRLGFDGARNLFVMNGGNGTFTEYASPYTAAPVKTIANPLNRVRGAGISGFAVDAAGDIFVANSSGNTVTEIAPPYVGPGRTIAVGLQTPIGLALDANGYLFVVNSGNSTVTEYAPPLYWVHQTVFTFQQCFCSYGGIMPSNYLNGLIAVH